MRYIDNGVLTKDKNLFKLQYQFQKVSICKVIKLKIYILLFICYFSKKNRRNTKGLNTLFKFFLIYKTLKTVKLQTMFQTYLFFIFPCVSLRNVFSGFSLSDLRKEDL